MPKQMRKRNIRKHNTIASPQNPPSLKSNIVLNHTFRYRSNNVIATAITSNGFLGGAGGICTVANTTLVGFFYALRIRRIKVWTITATAGTAATCSVEWQGQANTPNMEVSDTSINTAVPAMLNSVPPRNSLAANWATANTGQLCILTCPVGTIVDVSLQLVAWDGEANNSINTISAGTLGQVYYLALDQPSSTQRYVPISLSTTA
jgi:hypothetical protein